jgi:cyanophycin synthetase
VRLIETRLLEGPNVYRLEPVVKLEVAIGRRRTWYGQRDPGRHALVHLGAAIPARDWPDGVAALVAWIRRLRVDHGEGRGGVAVHRSSDPGHWIVTFPWVGAERAQTISDAAQALVGRDVSPVRTARLTGNQERLLARWSERIREARTSPPAWIRDADRRVPVVSISGTNGKSTVTRLITHILLGTGRHVGTTTSDGVLVDERLIEPGDWTGPGGAQQILARRDIEVAVLETARGGIVLRGVGYESNEVGVLTNVSSDHLDLQGIHTLPELAEVKATIARITKPDGWVVLNADDPYVAAVARRVKAKVAFFSLDEGSAVVRRHRAGGGRAYVIRRGWLVEANGERETRIVEIGQVPIAIGGLARHNVANALAAAAGARGLGATIEQVHDGLADFRPSAERSPGRLNLYRLGARVVIVDFAHNEAGVTAILDVAEGIAAGGAGRAAPITAIIGTAGDRPDDTLRGIGRIAAQRAQRVAIKQTLNYLRGRTPESVVGEILAGVRAGGGNVADVPIYQSETEALRAELNGSGGNARSGRRPDSPRVIVLMCHEERDSVFELLAKLGARPVDVASELTELVPRLQGRPRAD